MAKFKNYMPLFMKVYLIFGQTVNPLWQNMEAFEQISFAVNGQMLVNNLAIWSH